MEESIQENLSIVLAQQAKRINELEFENKKLKEKLSKYTNPKSSKTYYEKNKEVLREKQRIKYQKSKEISNTNTANSIEDYLKTN